ncbi:hypothetical protein [Desulfuribacillus alkaliarsenatis]|uniref:CHRD domain-containing protein n=1 Tax=Desulfuribacillus alkaliarsenatis TaxID=766136 RepID=A0A1E5G298_9FIRM|nr:hypothetical protein [Desulfuribacillus alkaliarsenatis]OEF97086.1 hypothetical protein BHF68_05665 [Desulfuribacillus alkaliarsenatis]
MKKSGINFLLLVLSVALITSGCGGSAQTLNTIGVNALAADPSAFTGEIAVAGVVQFVDSENYILRIIDEEEYASCGLTPCGGAGIIPLYLPIDSKPFGETPSGYTYTGQLPQLEDFVTVIGSIEQADGSLIFEVDRILKGSNVLISKQ